MRENLNDLLKRVEILFNADEGHGNKGSTISNEATISTCSYKGYLNNALEDLKFDGDALSERRKKICDQIYLNKGGE